MKKITVLMCALLMLAGCGIGDTNTTYACRDIGVQGEYETGQIVDMMPIKTEGSNTLGGLAGGVAGGAAGSMIGGNTAVNIIGATAGAVAGMMIGAKAEEALTSDSAYEFVIRKSNGRYVTVVQTNELNLRVGDRVYLSVVDGTTRIRSRVNY